MNKFLQFLTLLLIGFVITAVLTWPFTTKLSTFYKDGGDYSLFASVLWYNHQSLISGDLFDQEKYYRGYQFYPQPNTIAFGDNVLTLSSIFSIFFLLTKNFILSVNLMIFSNFIISFIASYYLINYLIKYKWASIFGAAVSTFNPLILTQYPDHIYGLFALSLVFLSFIKLLAHPETKNIIFFGVSLIIMIFTAIYLLIFSMLFLPLLAIPFLAFHFYKKSALNLPFLLKCAILGLVFIPLILFLVKPYSEFSRNEQATRKVTETVFFSARILDWMSSNPHNLIYGGIVRSYEKDRAPGPDFNGRFNYREHTLFINIISLLLFAIGVLYVIKRYKKEDQKFKLLIIGMFLILMTSFILTFGPYFMGWNGNTPYFKLPFYYLFEWIFFLKGMRVPTRFQMIFYIPFAIFISYGVYYLNLVIAKKKLFYLLTGALFLGILVENINRQDFSAVSANLNKLQDSSYQKNINFLYGKKVLHLPIHIPELGEWSFYTLNWGIITNSIALNGISGYAPPDQLDFLIKLKLGIDEEALKKLSAISVNYIVIHKDILGKEYEKYSKNWGLYQTGKVYEDAETLVVDLKKYNFSYKICNFDEDIQKNITKATLKNDPREFDVLVLKNNADCYLPSIYNEKYKNLKFNTSFLGSWDHTAFYRLPVIIGPFEQVILSEKTNNLRIDW